MITKAIVEEIISPYQVRIRIPLLDGVLASPMSTKQDSLNTATICTLPNCYMNIQVGDIVFVGFEDNTYYKAVVLGHLSREAMTDTYADVTFRNLQILDSATLPTETSIGDITFSEFSKLAGISENIQKQINMLKDDISIIYSKISGGNT